MNKDITPSAAVASGVEEAWRDIGAGFERFCLTAGIATLTDMMERDAADLCGLRYGREDGRRGHRWGQAAGKLGFHGGKMPIERPRVRARDGHELALPSFRCPQPLPAGSATSQGGGCVLLDHPLQKPRTRSPSSASIPSRDLFDGPTPAASR